METAIEVFDSRVQLMPGALETLRALRERGAKLVIFSQSPRRLVEGMLDRLGWLRRWTRFCCRRDRFSKRGRKGLCRDCAGV